MELQNRGFRKLFYLKRGILKMGKLIKSGKEILDDFFHNILAIPNVEEKLALQIKKMYEEGKLTNTNLSNKLTSLREEEINDKN